MKKIYYTFYRNHNFHLLLGATDKGLCYIGFDDKNLDEFLICCNKQFHHCSFEENHDKLLFATIQLDSYFEKTLTTFTIPLDFHGTDFQMKVWKALLEVEYGETVPYSKIAELIGNPKAIRAVGTAIGKNPVPIIIPCHRIISKDGSIGGFSGGLHNKIKLLELEKTR